MNFNFQFFSVLVLLLMGSFSLNAQSISGRVKAEGESLAYATVTLRKNRLTTNSDHKGRFKLSIPFTVEFPFVDTLEVSFIGYDLVKYPVYYEGEELFVELELEPHSERLDEAVVSAKKSLSALQILKKVERNIKKNYSQDLTLSDGFFREIVKENAKPTSISEAVINIQSVSYPQRHFYKKAFRAFYDHAPVDWLKTTDIPSFRHTIFFPEYIPVEKDRIALIHTRVTDNLTNTKYTLPTGGPTDLMALDKLKYGTDFFDRKVKRQYDFSKEGVKEYDGEYCYVIRFKPSEESSKWVRSPFNSETKSAIFQGELLISIDNFSLLHMEYQISPEAIFDNEWIRQNVEKVEVKYAELENGKMHLKSVYTKQSRNLYLIDELDVPATCERTLIFYHSEKESIKVDEPNRYYTCYGNNIFHNHFTYDSAFWSLYETSEFYPKLDAQVTAELGRNVPLDVQFGAINVPIDSVAAPEYAEDRFPIENIVTELKNKTGHLTSEVISSENEYSSQVFSKLRPEFKQYISEYARAFKYVADTSKAYPYFQSYGFKCRTKKNEKNESGLYVVTQNSEEKRILNLSAEGKGKENFNVEKLEISKDTTLILSYSVKGCIWSRLKVFENEVEVLKIDHVSDFKMINDSIIVYTLSEQPSFRVSKLFSLNIKNGKQVELYHESDVVYDLNIQSYFEYSEVFLTSECSDGNYLFHISEKNGFPVVDTLFKERDMFCEIKDFSENGIALLTKQSDEKDNIYTYDLATKKIGKKLYSSLYDVNDFVLTSEYLVVNQYENLSSKVYVSDRNTRKQEELKLPEEYGLADLEKGSEEDEIYIHYDAVNTPYTKFKIDFQNLKKKEVLDEKEFRGDQKYTLERKDVSAEGADVPLTLIYNKAAIKDSISGVVLRVYGAYGAQVFTGFSREDKVYMDKGFIIGYAHVRGNSSRGTSWYKDGKLENKKNTFEDYIACAEFVKREYVLERHQLIGSGVSAGGLVMGYVANNRPELFGTLIFDRPYLDMLNTMSDPDLPLTTGEYLEWGNPEDERMKEYIQSYSPYQNIRAANYPNMLFWLGLEDQQTPPWQVLPSVIRYRQLTTGDNLILAKCQEGEGHKGSISPAAEKLKRAQIFAFILEGINRK